MNGVRECAAQTGSGENERKKTTILNANFNHFLRLTRPIRLLQQQPLQRAFVRDFFSFFICADWLRNTHVRKTSFHMSLRFMHHFDSYICLDNRAARARTGSRLIRWHTVSTESLQQFAEKQRKKCIICSLRCFSSFVLCSHRPNGSRSKREMKRKKTHTQSKSSSAAMQLHEEKMVSGLPIRTHASTRAANSRL